nr:MAG: replication initiator protein [Microvirus sp.]
MAQCLVPRTVRDEVFPCGKCPTCTARNVSQWSFRLMQQLKQSSSAYFITLTYDTAFIPITASGQFSLSRVKNGADDLRLFFKRLRKYHGKGNQSIKYFAVGEYGSRTKRPHYHIILLNAKLELIQKAWTLGQIHYGDERGVNEASIGYCLKYIHKTCKIGTQTTDDRVPSFSRKSKGLGIDYLTPAIRAWHHADSHNRMYVNLQDGKKISMPRYYKLKLYEEALRKEIGEATLQRIREELAKQPTPTHRQWLDKQAAIKQSFIHLQTQNQKSKL